MDADRALRPDRLQLVLVLLGLAIAAVIGWRMARPDDGAASPRVIEGWAAVIGLPGEAPINSIGCCADAREDAGGSGYVVEGAQWRDLSDGADQSWRQTVGEPTCLQAGMAQRVRLGVVDVAAEDDKPGSILVVWYECLGAGVAHER
ncbi:MAG: hypothetical protein ACRDYW_00585 [Acidimicrobiales bacterium]